VGSWHGDVRTQGGRQHCLFILLAFLNFHRRKHWHNIQTANWMKLEVL
jgi:hypothetical protein